MRGVDGAESGADARRVGVDGGEGGTASTFEAMFLVVEMCQWSDSKQVTSYDTGKNMMLSVVEVPALLLHYHYTNLNTTITCLRIDTRWNRNVTNTKRI